MEKEKTAPWVPIAKNAKRLLPFDRPYTEIEALFCLQLDHNDGNPVTVLGYSTRWKWDRKTVRRFLKTLALDVVYAKDTSQTTKQRGFLKAGQNRDKKGTRKGQINFIDFSNLQGNRDKKGTRKGQESFEDPCQQSLLDPLEKEKENKEKTLSSPAGTDSAKKTSKPCVPNEITPHAAIVDLYHEILPELPRVKSWTEERQKQLRARWREDPKRQHLEWWQRYFEYVRQSPFLMGNGTRNWTADLEWLTKKGNMLKVIEVKYHSQ